MAFIRNTDKLVEGSSKLFFTNTRAKAAVQSDLDALSNSISSLETSSGSDISALDARLNIIEGGSGVAGSIAKAQADAQAYADQQVAALVNSAPSVLDTLKELSDAIGGDASFAATVAGQIGAVDDKVDQEILDRQTAVSGLDLRLDVLESDPTTKSYVDGIQSSLDGRLDVLEGADSVEGSVAKAEKDAKDYADSLDSAMDSRVSSLESDPTTKSYVDGIQSALDGRLDIIEGADSVEGSVAKAEKDAKDYADSLNSAMDLRVAALESDPTTKSYVDGEISSLQSALDGRLDVIEGVGEGSVAKAEQDAKDYADGLNSAMDARVDSLEADPTTKTYVDGEVSSLESEDLTFFKLDGSRAMTGGLRVKSVEKSANYNVSTSDYIIGVTSVTGGKTMTLPSASSMGAGKMFIIKDQSGSASVSNYIRLSCQPGQTIDGQSSYDIDAPYESVSVYSNGTNWFIM
ncbi:hypothetical protein EB118_04125 [bacterium]|nr:hypothetical protein [bacterium]